MANIKLENIGAIPSTYAKDNDARLFQNDEILCVASVRNAGMSAVKPFKVWMRVDSESQEELIYDLGPGEERWVQFIRTEMSEGDHELEVWADFGDWIDESNEGDNRLSHSFTVLGGDRYAVIDMEPEEIEIEVTDEEWRKAGWHKVTVYAQVWDFRGDKMRDRQAYLQVEGVPDWHQANLDDGAVEFKGVYVHPNGSLHLRCDANDATGVIDVVEGTFRAELTENAVKLDAWQDADAVTIEKATQKEVEVQLSAEGKVSFEILGVGAEVGGGASRTTRESEGNTMSWRVLIAKPNLIPKEPDREP